MEYKKILNRNWDSKRYLLGIKTFADIETETKIECGKKNYRKDFHFKNIWNFMKMKIHCKIWGEEGKRDTEEHEEVKMYRVES